MHQELSLEVQLLMTCSASNGSSTVVVLHKGYLLDEWSGQEITLTKFSIALKLIFSMLCFYPHAGRIQEGGGGGGRLHGTNKTKCHQFTGRAKSTPYEHIHVIHASIVLHIKG